MVCSYDSENGANERKYFYSAPKREITTQNVVARESVRSLVGVLEVKTVFKIRSSVDLENGPCSTLVSREPR